MSGVVRKHDWTDQELKDKGFEHVPRKKELIMARVLPAAEAPLQIRTQWGEILIAQAGYMICYIVGDETKPKLSDYEHWPVEAEIFAKTYKPWDEAFQPSPAQSHLIGNGCKPYYKAAGVWAKTLEEDIYIQGVEHEKPVLVTKERVLAIGAEGEPYHMGSKTFHDRYDASLGEANRSPVKRMVNRLIKFFKGNES
jgi:hypothetical protein